MKRTPLSRSAPLNRGDKPLRRETRLRPVNRQRVRWKYARNFGPKADALRGGPCIIAGCPWPAEPAHAKPRQMGGCGGGASVLVNLCRSHHDEAGEYRTSARAAFESRYGLDLIAEAARIDAEWKARAA